MILDRIRPYLPYLPLLGIPAAIVAMPGAYGVVEPFAPATHNFVREELTPVRIDTLQNTLAIISAEKQAIKVRLQMAGARLAIVPSDEVAQAAWKAADEDWDGVILREGLAQCALRRASGLGCAGG